MREKYENQRYRCIKLYVLIERSFKIMLIVSQIVFQILGTSPRTYMLKIREGNFTKDVQKDMLPIFSYHVATITLFDVASQFAYTVKHLLSNKPEVYNVRGRRQKKPGSKIGNWWKSYGGRSENR